MALGTLYIVFAVMAVLAVIGTAALFLVKRKFASDAILILMAVYSLAIAFVGATAQPSNFIGQQVLSWAVGLVAVLGAWLRFGAKHQVLAGKLLVVVSVLGGICCLFFL